VRHIYNTEGGKGKKKKKTNKQKKQQHREQKNTKQPHTVIDKLVYVGTQDPFCDAIGSYLNSCRGYDRDFDKHKEIYIN